MPHLALESTRQLSTLFPVELSRMVMVIWRFFKKGTSREPDGVALR